MAYPLPPIFNGRQNLDEWIRQMQSVCILNGCPDDEALRLGRLRLKPEIFRAEQNVAEADDRRNLQDLKTYL